MTNNNESSSSTQTMQSEKSSLDGTVVLNSENDAFALNSENDAVASNKENETVVLNREKSLDETVILNVGGFKYETYRSTLTAYPNTFLGTMFQERNRSLLVPRNGNEYFFDRSGQIFHYIIQFYRTGKINLSSQVGLMPISLKEIEVELDYFQIPRPISSTIDKIVISKLNALVNTFKELIKEVAEYYMNKNSFKTFKAEIDICFLDNGQATVKAGLDKSLTDTFDSTRHYAYNIMSIYRDEIKKYLKGEYPELTWFDEHKVGSVHYYKIRLTIVWSLNHDKSSHMTLIE